MTGSANSAPARRLFVYGAASQKSQVTRLATIVAEMHQAEVVKLQRRAKFPSDWLLGRAALANDADEAQANSPRPELCGLVADWPETPDEAQDMMAVANQLKAPAYILRHTSDQPLKRIVAATAGGVHALHVLALAETLSQAMNLPVAMLRIDSPLEAVREPPKRGLDALLARSFVLGRVIELTRANDIVRQIDAQAGPNDLLVIGAPHFGVATSHFEGSLPEQLARIHDGPILMCLSEPPGSLPFRDFLWEINVCLDVRGRNRDGVIRLLADRLCESGVVPEHLRQVSIKRALAREALGTTVVGCETAIPHARLPNYAGVAAALAICPDGVVFDSKEETPHFVFLMISSARSHDRYLGALARIARNMLDLQIRQALLSCTTPTAVMDVLTGNPL